MDNEQHAIRDAIRLAQTRHRLFPHLLDEWPDSAADVDDLRALRAALQPLIVGVSGGADSICLLHVLHELAQMWRLALHVAHLDHGLRPDSAADADWVGQLAHALHLPFHTARIEPGLLAAGRDGIEAAARDARYAFLHRVARAVGQATPRAPIVAVAHHADDQAETVLMNLIRGSGLAGLGGMLPVTRLPLPPNPAPDAAGRQPADTSRAPVRLIRPLLGISRAAIHAYLKERKLGWREDPTNRDPAHLRNRLRHEILPVLANINPQIHATLARTADSIAGDGARLAHADLQTLDNLLCQHFPPLDLAALHSRPGAQRLVLDANKLRLLPWAARRGVLRQAVACFALPPRAVGYAEIERLLDACPAPAPVVTENRAAASVQPAPGPHPLAGGLYWSWLAATTGPGAPQPPRLSLHLAHQLPWQPDHPHLGQPGYYCRFTPPDICRLSAGAEQNAGAGQSHAWTLHTRLLAPAGLPPNWPRGVSRWEAWLDADYAREYILTTPQSGMSIAPLGMQGHTQALGDLFTNAKIHPSLRPGWPLILASPASASSADPAGAPALPIVLWVCGLTVGQPAAITPATRRILHLYWRPHP